MPLSETACKMEDRVMAVEIEAWKSELAALTMRDRAELAHFLLHSLEQATDEDQDVESSWDAELARRVAEIEDGTGVGKPADQVFAELREKYS